MQYLPLGNTYLDISRLCLGAIAFNELGSRHGNIAAADMSLSDAEFSRLDEVCALKAEYPASQPVIQRDDNFLRAVKNRPGMKQSKSGPRYGLA